MLAWKDGDSGRAEKRWTVVVEASRILGPQDEDLGEKDIILTFAAKVLSMEK